MNEIFSFCWSRGSRKRVRNWNRREPIHPFFVREICKEFGVEIFVDVGANVGMYSLLGASVEGVEEVHAFEPVRSSLRELRMNIKLNEMDRDVHVHEAAALDHTGCEDFAIFGRASGLNGLVEDLIHDKSKSIGKENVDCIRVDDVVKCFGKRVFVKIDVEGSEIKALMGMKNLLKNNKVIIQVESHNGQNGECCSWLREFGFDSFVDFGSDVYFTNCFDYVKDVIVLNSLSSAIKEFTINSNQCRFLVEGRGLVTVPIPFRSAVHVTGPVAKMIKSIRERLKR